MLENKPLRSVTLLWDQWNQSTTSVVQKSGRTASGPTESQSKWLEWNCLSCKPEFQLKKPRVHSGAVIDTPETANLILPPFPEIFWQQPKETHLTTNDKNLTAETHQNTHMQTEKWSGITNVANNKNPPKNSHPLRNHSWKIKLGARQ